MSIVTPTLPEDNAGISRKCHNNAVNYFQFISTLFQELLQVGEINNWGQIPFLSQISTKLLQLTINNQISTK